MQAQKKWAGQGGSKCFPLTHTLPQRSQSPSCLVWWDEKFPGFKNKTDWNESLNCRAKAINQILTFSPEGQQSVYQIQAFAIMCTYMELCSQCWFNIAIWGLILKPAVTTRLLRVEDGDAMVVVILYITPCCWRVSLSLSLSLSQSCERFCLVLAWDSHPRRLWIIRDGSTAFT